MIQDTQIHDDHVVDSINIFCFNKPSRMVGVFLELFDLDEGSVHIANDT